VFANRRCAGSPDPGRRHQRVRPPILSCPKAHRWLFERLGGHAEPRAVAAFARSSGSFSASAQPFDLSAVELGEVGANVGRAERRRVLALLVRPHGRGSPKRDFLAWRFARAPPGPGRRWL